MKCGNLYANSPRLSGDDNNMSLDISFINIYQLHVHLHNTTDIKKKITKKTFTFFSLQNENLSEAKEKAYLKNLIYQMGISIWL